MLRVDNSPVAAADQKPEQQQSDHLLLLATAAAEKQKAGGQKRKRDEDGIAERNEDGIAEQGDVISDDENPSPSNRPPKKRKTSHPKLKSSKSKPSKSANTSTKMQTRCWQNAFLHSDNLLVFCFNGKSTSTRADSDAPVSKKRQTTNGQYALKKSVLNPYNAMRNLKGDDAFTATSFGQRYVIICRVKDIKYGTLNDSAKRKETGQACQELVNHYNNTYLQKRENNLPHLDLKAEKSVNAALTQLVNDKNEIRLKYAARADQYEYDCSGDEAEDQKPNPSQSANFSASASSNSGARRLSNSGARRFQFQAPAQVAPEASLHPSQFSSSSSTFFRRQSALHLPNAQPITLGQLRAHSRSSAAAVDFSGLSAPVSGLPAPVDFPRLPQQGARSLSQHLIPAAANASAAAMIPRVSNVPSAANVSAATSFQGVVNVSAAASFQGVVNVSADAKSPAVANAAANSAASPQSVALNVPAFPNVAANTFANPAARAQPIVANNPFLFASIAHQPAQQPVMIAFPPAPLQMHLIIPTVYGLQSMPVIFQQAQSIPMAQLQPQGFPVAQLQPQAQAQGNSAATPLLLPLARSANSETPVRTPKP